MYWISITEYILICMYVVIEVAHTYSCLSPESSVAVQNSILYIKEGNVVLISIILCGSLVYNLLLSQVTFAAQQQEVCMH